MKQKKRAGVSARPFPCSDLSGAWFGYFAPCTIWFFGWARPETSVPPLPVSHRYIMNRALWRCGLCGLLHCVNSSTDQLLALGVGRCFGLWLVVAVCLTVCNSPPHLGFAPVHLEYGFIKLHGIRRQLIQLLRRIRRKMDSVFPIARKI